MITSTTQAVHSTAVVKKILAASEVTPTRDADEDSDRSLPREKKVSPPGKGGVIDVYG
jgi:hypothetical protein